MLSQERVSVPHEPGSTVAILSPFLPGQVYDGRDRFRFYKRQEAALVGHFEGQGHKTETYMRATMEDFGAVLGNTAVSSIVVTGWGNFTSLSVPLSRQKSEERFAQLNWLRLAGMTEHLKTGPMVMMQCLLYPNKEFNPPLFLGLASSHAHILGRRGEKNFAGNTKRRHAELPGSITESVNLTYDEIKSSYKYLPGQHPDEVPVMDVATHGAAYNAARLARGAIRSCVSLITDSETGSFDRQPEPSVTPNLGEYKRYFQEIDFAQHYDDMAA